VRFAFAKGSREERETVRRRAAHLLHPDAVLDLLRRLPGSGVAVAAQCTALRCAKDRYVIRVAAKHPDGSSSSYALKGYADERGGEIGALCERVGDYWRRRGEPCPAVLPLCYLAGDRLLVLPWVEGVSLAEAVAAGRLELVRQAAQRVPHTLAKLHATPVVPEEPTGPATMVAITEARWLRHYRRFPEARPVIEPLNQALRAALARLAPARPALVHGDTGPGNFLYDGARWRVLDLDTYGFADPAYDVGYLLAKLENQCLAQPALEPHAGELVEVLRRGCLAAMPDLSPRNVAFYYGMTLTRKTLARAMRAARRGGQRFDHAAAPIAARVRAALAEAAWQ
jgi:aminoglycoside phosphotransferase (APT) family kinase protein